MKILFVTHRYPPHTGGVETHVQKIATQLADCGCNIIVFSADASDDIPDESVQDGVRIRRFRSVRPSGAFYFAPQMVHAIRQTYVDVIHAHNYHALPLFFAALGSKKEKFIVTTHYHGESDSRMRNNLLTAYKPFGRWAIKQADEVISVSEWESDQLQQHFCVRGTVIPNGLDIKRFRNAVPEKRDNPYILCVGRLESYKNIQSAICALPELSEYDLVVAGSGPYQDSLKQVAVDEGVADRVEFLGFVEDERLPRLYAGADVYVTLSEFEAYGMTVAEALAAGTPCIVRETGALQDWVDRDGVSGIAELSPNRVSEIIKNKPSKPNTPYFLHTWEEIAMEVKRIYCE